MGIRELREKHGETFTEFFAAYPRKTDRQPALHLWVELIEDGADPQFLIDKARSYGRNVDPRDLKYTPSPKAWLRDRKWEDEDLFTDQKVSEREWLIGRWQVGDARAVVEKYGFIYVHPPVPEGVADREAWHMDQRKAWVAAIANHILHGEDLPE